MVKQKIIKSLDCGAIVRSRGGKTYEAVFKSKVMKIPEDADLAEIEFINNTPVITRFYFTPKEETPTLKKLEKIR